MTNADTRLFLARVMAWPQDGEAPAFVNIHNTFTPKEVRKDKKGNPIWPWSGRGCRDLNEAINYINWQATSGGRDVYYCTSTQALGKRRDVKGGRVMYDAVRSQDNAVKSKALFIDIDLKEGDKGYSTAGELVTALAKFLADSGMPKPTMTVQTGGGVHVYWLLAEALTIEPWMELAYALAEAIRRHGLKCDSQCTIDMARVLRVPGTKNFKYDPPQPVTLSKNYLEFDYSNDKIVKVLEPYKTKVPYTMSSVNMALFPPKAPLQGQSDLQSGIDLSGAQPVDIVSVIPECGFITEAMATGGRDFTNPLWNLTTLISTFTLGGKADARAMANGHPDYSEGETDALFERKSDERVTRDLGWPTCAAIAASGCSACSACAHFKEGKSPLNFARKAGQDHPDQHIVVQTAQHGQLTSPGTTTPANPQTPAQTPSQPSQSPMIAGMYQDPDMPENYLRHPDGRIFVSYNGEAGSLLWRQISSYPMRDPWLQKNPWVLNFKTATEHGQETTVSISMKDVNTGEMRKELQEQGFMLTGGTRGFQDVADFIMAWIQKLQREKNAIISSVPFGWAVRNGKTSGFVYSGRMFTPQGEEVALNTDPELARQFTPTGDKQDWINCALIVTDQRRPALDAIIASAFAGPLVRFTGHSGLLLSAYSVESGIGKSTALKIAQAVWGDPVKAVQSLSDTQNSVLNKMGELKSLPLYWDELQSDEDARRFVDTVFRLTLGKEKSRMTSKVQQRTPGTWQTLMVAASNDSLMDAVANRTKATMAGVYRVFEYTVAPAKAGAPGQIDPTVAQRMLSKLNDNYGQIGLEYARYLGSNIPKVEQHMANILRDLSTKTKMNPDERFWVSMVATLLLGATYANHLGFTNIDVDGLRDFLLDNLERMRRIRSTHTSDIKDITNVVSLLGRFLNEKRMRNTIMTNVIYKGRGKPHTGTITVEGTDLTKLDTIMVHIGKQDRSLRIGRSYLTEWLVSNGHPRQVFFDALTSQLRATYVNARLGAGTPVSGASEHLIEIDMTSTPLIDFISER